MNSGGRRCIVIGAGIVGSCCAWHLQARGARVTLIDSVMPGMSTSFGNAGCISPSSVFPYSYPGAIRQVPGWLIDPLGPMRIRWSQAPGLLPWLWRFWRSGSAARVAEIAADLSQLMAGVAEDYDQILQACGAEDLRRARGLIMLYDRQRDFEDDAWHYELRERFGLPWKRLSRGELADLEPELRLDAQGTAVYDPAWQHVVDPHAVTRCIADDAVARGAVFHQDRALSVEATEAEVRVSTAGGAELHADHLIVAAGVWSNALISQLGIRVPLASKRGYHSMLPDPSAALSHPVMSVSRMFVMTPMSGGLRLAGTAEFAAIDAPPDYRRARVLVTHGRHYLPGLTSASVSEWMGQRPMMPDSKPVLGALSRHQRVWCAFGHGHYGLTLGPKTGRIIASLIFGEPVGMDLAPFSADRF